MRLRGTGRVNNLIGWVLIGMSALALITVIILGLTIEAWLFVFLFAPALLLIGGGINLRMGHRARLEIGCEGFVWCGFVGKPRSLAWHDVHRIFPPPEGASPRLAAVAGLTDGRYVEVEALWLSPTSPGRFFSRPDHREAQQLLMDGHRAYLARTRSPSAASFRSRWS